MYGNLICIHGGLEKLSRAVVSQSDGYVRVLTGAGTGTEMTSRVQRCRDGEV